MCSHVFFFMSRFAASICTELVKHDVPFLIYQKVWDLGAFEIWMNGNEMFF